MSCRGLTRATYILCIEHPRPMQRAISNGVINCYSEPRLVLLQSHEILNDFFAVERFIQKQKNAAGKEMEKKADINLVDLAGRSVVFALFSLQCCSSFFIPEA